MNVQRVNTIIKPDQTRVFLQPFDLQKERSIKVVARVLLLAEAEVEAEVEQVLSEFGGRHQTVERFFLKRFEALEECVLSDEPLSEARKLLIGAYFSKEYSLESAALFNPSMIWHPDQSRLPEGSRRFVLSLRATGEGHLSSLTFRSGTIDAKHRIRLNKPTRFVTVPEIVPDPTYEKWLFNQKLSELGLSGNFTERIMEELEETFTMSELKKAVEVVQARYGSGGRRQAMVNDIIALAQSNYEISYLPHQKFSERVIFPFSPAELNGIEDARFVQFQNDDETIYYATYTAYNGTVMLPQLLKTTDFLTFKISTLNGSEVKNKGMALFPRKINGYYAMLSRQDGENIFVMFSDNIHFWYSKQLLLKPTFSWEFVQLGNCGSPIETEAGWLVLSHGVGPMRRYALSAFLLDLDDPTRVIGRLHEPLLTADTNEREGYVPNVIYSCGGQVHAGKLIIPYAMSDYASSFAMVDLAELLDELTTT